MVVLVTGCGAGIGLGTAVEAARRGHVVYAGLRDLARREALEAASAGLEVVPLQLDVTVEGDRDAAVARVLEEQGRIDALVNNAGVVIGGFLEEIEEDELRQLLDVNLIGAWSLTRAVLPAMRAEGRGTVVMVSSRSGRVGFPGLGAYAASKFALEGMTEAWRHELAPFGIRVTLVEPGTYRTDMLDRNRRFARRSGDPSSPYAPLAERLLPWYDRAALRGRDPQEVARSIVDLLEARRVPLRRPLPSGPWAALRRAVQRWLMGPVLARLWRGR